MRESSPTVSLSPRIANPCRSLHQRGERAGVRGSHKLRRRHLLLPLTLTPQAGRGNKGLITGGKLQYDEPLS
jgi:hypothetical protein